MAITADQILYERARAQDSEAGTLSGEYIRNAVAGDLFKKIPTSLFVSGGQIVKKAHIRFNASTLISEAHLGVVPNISAPSGVIVALWAGADGQNSTASSAGPMVVGTVAADLVSGATVVDVNLERGEPLSWFTGWIDGSTMMAMVAGTPTYLPTDPATPPADQGGGVWRFTLNAAWSGVTVAAGTRISQRLTITNAKPSASVVPGYAAISLDDAQVIVDPAGVVDDTITFTFTSATEFNASSSEFGLLTGGTTTTDTVLVNPDTGLTMATIPAAAWSGSANNGDTIQLNLTPSALPFFVGIDIAAGTAEQSIQFDLTHDVLG